MSINNNLPNDFESKAKKPPKIIIGLKVKRLDNLMRLSTAELHRAGVFSSNTSHYMTVEHFGHAIGKIELRAYPNFLCVQYPKDIFGAVKLQDIILTKTKCNYGGVRTWFKCRDCQKRVAVLYWQDHFKCRKCIKLHYASQYQSEQDRLFAKVRRIRRELGGSESMAEPFPERPKGMHMITYVKRFFDHEVAATIALSIWQS